MMASNDQLISLLQALPAELFHNIYELTFTPRTDKVDITKSYRPPIELQIDRASRQLFARKYYGSNKFFTGNAIALVHWLRHLRVERIERLADVRFCIHPNFYSDNFRSADSRSGAAIMAMRTARWYLYELVCSANEDWGWKLRWVHCNFLRVEDTFKGVPSESVATIAQNGRGGRTVHA